MDRRAWIFVFGAAALVVAVVLTFWRDEPAEPATLSESIDRGARGIDVRPGAPAGSGDGDVSPASSAQRPMGPTDAGTNARIEGASASRTPPAADARRGPSDDVGAEQSAGWRLGRARRRVAILTPRIERLRARVAELEAEGEAQLADRQRSVLDRTVRRMEEVQQRERELAAAAEADGTLGDVDRGYEEGEPVSSRARSVAQARRPPATE